MSLYQIYFSPTGGTKKAADLVAGVWEQRAEAVDLSGPATDFSPRAFGPKDICIVAVPSFGGRIPSVAAERLRAMSGGGAAAVLLCVYGNRAYEDALRELCDLLGSRGFRCAAAIAAVAEHSIMHCYAAGRPDAEDERELTAFAEKIKARLEARISGAPLAVRGNFPYREYHPTPPKPSASAACTQCGLCAARCPVGAIPAADPRQTDAERCIICMQCVALCPERARALDPAAVAALTAKLEQACSSRKANELFL